MVAPHAGAWIETRRWRRHNFGFAVAPHAGAWIETDISSILLQFAGVAPHAGAWIETVKCRISLKDDACRTPCGCVD